MICDATRLPIIVPPRRALLSLLALLAAAAACAAPHPVPETTTTATKPAPPAPPAAAAPVRRLQARGEMLFVTAPPDTYKRGELLYVLDDRPLHGSTRLRIGLVQVTEPKPVKVTWYCRPSATVDAVLSGGGLPVEDFVPDTTVRVGKCWGRYAPPAGAATGPGSDVELELNLGEGDGLRPGDLFEVLGDPIPDEQNRTVVGFHPLGRCAIVAFEGTPLTSSCRIDRTVWPDFDPSSRPSGGFVRLVPVPAASQQP